VGEAGPLTFMAVIFVFVVLGGFYGLYVAKLLAIMCVNPQANAQTVLAELLKIQCVVSKDVVIVKT
jgi:hypothetical protein